MKIIIFGKQGQLGKFLCNQIFIKDYKFKAFSKAELDITDIKKVDREICSFGPDLIINASAYTSVDEAEDEQELANLINNLAVKNLSDICKKYNASLIHISTDYVFDGNSNRPYKENDEPNPKSIYGKTKYLGEEAIKSSGCRYVIIRTSWVFSEYGKNFLKSMLNLAKSKSELNIVDDQIGSPTYAKDLALAIVHIIPFIESNKCPWGIYHYSGNEECSWYYFASQIFYHAKKMGLKTPLKLNSIKTSEFPTKAKRPILSVLCNKKFTNTFNFEPSNWHQGIKKTLLSLEKN